MEVVPTLKKNHPFVFFYQNLRLFAINLSSKARRLLNLCLSFLLRKRDKLLPFCLRFRFRPPPPICENKAPKPNPRDPKNCSTYVFDILFYM